jgi:ParB family chromosome partitioning protein
MIPVDAIDVLNPRERNAKTFAEIVASIKAVGLKKPITVAPRAGPDGAERYLLVCGEGRLMAFMRLGEPRIPALIANVTNERAFVMGLVENIARRKFKPMELLAGIVELREKGYDAKQIAQKTGLTEWYVLQLLILLAQGEERLLVALESGKIPLSVAIGISSAKDDKSVQIAMQEAYESGQLRGAQLMFARKLVERRQMSGKAQSSRRAGDRREVTSSSLVRAYQKEVKRQQALIRRSSICQRRLMFLTGALRTLLADEGFVNVLRAESLDTLPKYFAERLRD